MTDPARTSPTFPWVSRRYTEDDIQLVAAWFSRRFGTFMIRRCDREYATEVLDVLAAAGRLLTPGDVAVEFTEGPPVDHSLDNPDNLPASMLRQVDFDISPDGTMAR